MAIAYIINNEQRELLRGKIAYNKTFFNVDLKNGKINPGDPDQYIISELVYNNADHTDFLAIKETLPSTTRIEPPPPNFGT